METSVNVESRGIDSLRSHESYFGCKSDVCASQVPTNAPRAIR
jgi:hypothetical protein